MSTHPAAAREDTAARLLPLIGRHVRTPLGVGVLERVQGAEAWVRYEQWVERCHVATVQPVLQGA